MTSDAVCPKCGGTGFIIIERANISGAEPCDCRAQGRAARLEDRSQIPPLYRNASFDNFVVPGIENPTARRELTTVLLAVKKFASDFPHDKGPQGLLLIGEVGCGKTHLAVAALRQIIASTVTRLCWITSIKVTTRLPTLRTAMPTGRPWKPRFCCLTI